MQYICPLEPDGSAQCVSSLRCSHTDNDDLRGRTCVMSVSTEDLTAAGPQTVHVLLHVLTTGPLLLNVSQICSRDVKHVNTVFTF